MTWLLHRNADSEFAEWWSAAQRNLASCPIDARPFIESAIRIGPAAVASVSDETALKTHQWAQRLPGFVLGDAKKAIVFEEEKRAVH